MKKSRVAVFREPGVPLQLESVQLPTLRPGHVLVEVQCCTICGSDVHTLRGDRAVSGPTVLGHETIGRIARLPEPTSAYCDYSRQPLHVGDRITWSLTASCGECFFCLHELPQKCEHLFKYGHQAANAAQPASGGLAEYCLLVPGTTIVKIPPGLSDEVACPANCATATAAAALRRAGACRAQTIVIHGAGMLGLTACAMLREQDVAHIFVTDSVTDRCQQALRFGASAAFDKQSLGRLRHQLDQATAGRGADVVLEMSGASDAVSIGIEQLRVGGQLILVGSVFPVPSIPVLPEQIVRRMLLISGVHNYGPEDLIDAIRFLERAGSQFPFEQLVGGQFSLDEVNEAVAQALAGAAPRIAVRPHANQSS